MTATPVFARSTSHLGVGRYPARGLDRAVMILSLAMLRWARRRADRRAIAPEEVARRIANQRSLDSRLHASAMLAARVR